MDLLPGLQTLGALSRRMLARRFGADQQLSRQLLQGGDLLLRVQQLTLDLLQEDKETGTDQRWSIWSLIDRE